MKIDSQLTVGRQSNQANNGAEARRGGNPDTSASRSTWGEIFQLGKEITETYT